MTSLKHSARAVQDALAAAGLDCTVVELPASTRTAQEAATAIGCSVAQIAKSIVFRTADSERAVLVIASGAKRIVPARLESVLGEQLEKATPEFVRATTGYAIGGVPPCGHRQPVMVFIDRDLFELATLWAAAGTPNAVFALSPAQLLALTGGTVIAVT
jgi:prolyl-tRNA editing enzyme YbaK/EbsC (Cys-tRNA(Pro) deacylase)